MAKKREREPVKHRDEEAEEDNSSEETADSDSEPEQELTKKSSPPPQGSSSGEEESDEDSDEDSGEPDVKVKFTKPVQKSEDVASEPTPASNSTVSKKSKKKQVPQTPLSTDPDSSKKVLFQRIWSDEDEIAILKGMIKYTDKKKANPTADPDAFLNYIKKDLHIEVKKEQLLDKIRRIKKKFETSRKNGRNLTKPHDKQMFDLSQDIWGTMNGGGDTAEASTKTNGNVAKKTTRMNAKVLKNEEGASGDTKEKALPPMIFRSKSNYLTVDERVLKIGAELFEGVNEGVNEDEERARKWRKLMIEDMEISNREKAVKIARAKLVLDALKSPK